MSEKQETSWCGWTCYIYAASYHPLLPSVFLTWLSLRRNRVKSFLLGLSTVFAYQSTIYTLVKFMCAPSYASTWTTVSTAGSVISPLTNELKPKQPKEKLSIHMDEFMCLLAFRRHAQWPLVGSRFAQKKKEREAEASSSGILTFYLFEQSYAKMFDEVFSPSKWHQIITRNIAKCDILSACIPELFAFACNANLLNQFITWYDLQVKASTISRLGIILNRFGKLKPYCYCVTTAAYNEYE